MTLNDFFSAIAGISGLLFVVTSMLAMGLGTAQRNISAAIVMAAQNFTEGNTLTFILVASVLMLLVLVPTAKQLGAHATVPDRRGTS